MERYSTKYISIMNRYARTRPRLFLHRFLSTVFVIFTAFILLPFNSERLRAQTEVEGEVWGVWDVEGSPYLVIDTLTVPEDCTLTIEPGVTVEFQDQDENQYPILLYGALEAIGEEGDSIYFLSEDSTFPGFYSDNDHRDMSVIMEYCVVDSAHRIIDINHPEFAVLRHSRFHITGLVMQNFGSADTVEYCDFNYTGEADYGAISYNSGGPYLFSNNSGNIRFNITIGTIAPVYGNNIHRLRFSSASAEVYDNILASTFEVVDGVMNVHDNVIGSIVNLINCRGTFERNSMNNLRASSCSPLTIENNHFTNALYDNSCNIYNSSVTFRGNLFTAQGDAIELSNSSGLVENNTIFFNYRGIRCSNSDEIRIQNNIFVGDGVNSYGVYVFPGHDEPVNTSYNCFYNVTDATNGYEIDEGNILQDPRLNAGEPFDYNLRANSPCIDAGNPNTPDDPDGTRADIGAFFYDQSIDNPPALISPVRLIEQAGTEFNYTALAIDDEGPLTFHFENLPDWLEEEENNLAWVADSAIVEGTIPDDIEEFEFNVYVEDSLGQTDTAYVFCELVTYTLLRGVTTGIISAEDSPFLVVEDVIVPRGDSLVIEPGVTCYFKSVEHLDHRLKFDVRGTFIAEGTEEDTISFVPELGSEGNRQWRGIWLTGPNQDTSKISHALFEYGTWSIRTDSSAIIEIDSCYFTNNWDTIELRYNTISKITRCRFLSEPQYYSTFIELYNATTEIRNSCFEVSPEDYNSTLISDNYHPSTITIDSCKFISGGTIQITDTSGSILM